MEVVKVENVARVYQIGKVETQALRGVNLTIEMENSPRWLGLPVPVRPPSCKCGCLISPFRARFNQWQGCNRLNRNQRADMRRGTIGFIFNSSL